MSLECALMSEEFLTLEVCCCDMQAHSDGGGMSLVLASLSSALCIYNSEICDTKKCPVSCSEAPLARFSVLERCCKDLRVTFLLFAVNSFFDLLCQCVFCLFSLSLCFPKHGLLLSPLLYKGL